MNIQLWIQLNIYGSICKLRDQISTIFIKRSVMFNLHKHEANDTSNLAIRMCVTIGGERPFDFPVCRKIDLDQWDAEAERAALGAKEVDEIN